MSRLKTKMNNPAFHITINNISTDYSTGTLYVTYWTTLFQKPSFLFLCPVSGFFPEPKLNNDLKGRIRTYNTFRLTVRLYLQVGTCLGFKIHYPKNWDLIKVCGASN
jgi:hypothetical protein